eukprot:2934268-Prymnesium_polylepis.1
MSGARTGGRAAARGRRPAGAAGRAAGAAEMGAVAGAADDGAGATRNTVSSERRKADVIPETRLPAARELSSDDVVTA